MSKVLVRLTDVMYSLHSVLDISHKSCLAAKIVSSCFQDGWKFIKHYIELNVRESVGILDGRLNTPIGSVLSIFTIASL